ncbi:MAG: leucine-rich repeat domain-containing protein [Bacteroidaceae bacterium]|nr:leucine-rich repeat domain-containing protein [Bacteroidaceae bacterium]
MTIKYEYDKAALKATVCGVDDCGTSVVIPATVEYYKKVYKVTTIGKKAFFECKALENIVIPNSVTSIGEEAFRGCSGLTSITIPNSVKSIGNDAFRYCHGLTSVTIPNSVTSIGDYAFLNCSGLTSIEIPNSVTSIKNNAFSDCSGLTSISVASDNTVYDSRENCNAIIETATNTLIAGCKNTIIPNSVTSIRCSAFSGCPGLKSITIPNSVTGIGNYAFYKCSGITSITIPNSVTSIGEYAFYGCKGLTSIEIPNSVTSIRDYAFRNCSGLTSVIIGNSVTSIGDYAFDDCSGLTSIEIPNSVTSIGRSAFSSCSGLTSIEIPNSVTSIGNNAFRGCSGLTSITIGNSVTSIGDYAFDDCSCLTSIEIPNSVTSIGDYAFNGCASLKELRIEDGEGTLSLGYNTYGSYDTSKGLFYDCPLETLYLGRNLSYNTGGIYGYSPFYNIKTLASVTIGNSVTSIGNYAFYNCTGLTSIVIGNSVTSIGSDAFYGCTGLTSIVIGNSVTSIGSDAFYGCTGLTSITIPNSVTSIGYSAFSGCTGLKEVHIGDLAAWCGIDFASAPANPLRYAHNLYLNGELVTDLVIPDGVTEIKDDAFRNCSGLTSIVIPNSVTSIGSYAFSGCTGLKTVYNFSNLTFSKGSSEYGYVAYYATKVINAPNAIIDGDFIWCKLNGANTLACYLGEVAELTLPVDYNGENYVIGNDAFNGCTGLTNIEIPNSVTSIESSAFNGCTGLTNIEIPNSVTSIESSAFSGCTGLTSIEIPNSVTSIGSDAFNGCTGLTSIVIPNSITSIGDYAFYGCSGLTNIEIPNSVTSIGNQAFENCTGLKTVINFSNLTFSKGSEGSGYIAYYATKVINAPNAVIDGDFIWCNLNGANTLACYLGEVAELTLPVDYNGENYVIGNDAFNGCTGLASVVIPSSVTSIGEDAFTGCTGLKTVYNFSNLTFSKGENTNGYVAYYADKVYNAPNGSMEGDFIFGKPNDVNTLLYYLGNTANLVLPADYNGENYVIDSMVFKDNTVITSVTIPNSVTSVVASAFNGCSGLKEVHISDLSAWCNIAFASADANPLYYAENLYLNDELLTELTIPDSVTEVKNFAFYNCSGLTSIEILDGVTGIGEEAFRGCSDLEYIYISSTIESIGDYAFAECNNIFDIKIGSKKVVAASENVFSSDAYNNACLYVPAGRKDFYAKTSPWSNFIISEMDFTGIDDMEAEGERVKDVYYDLSGRVVENPTNGVYIINGKKVIIK